MWYRRGDTLARMGYYGEALSCFDQVIEVQPNHHAAWVFRAVALIHLERYQQALESCDRALRLYPTSPEAWLFRGVALQRLGKFRLAYGCFSQAMQPASKSQTTLWQKLMSWLRKGDKPAAQPAQL